MLVRAGGDASTKLRRTQSATSVKQRRHRPLIQQTINPDTARIHAIAAAQIAIGRANERAAIEMRRSTELARCDSNAGRPGKLTKTQSQTFTFSPASQLRRQRSILQSKGLDIVSSLHQPGVSPHGDLSRYATPPPSELAAIDKYGSESSSYRKIRKTKSLITPRKRATSMHNVSSCSPSSA